MDCDVSPKDFSDSGSDNKNLHGESLDMSVKHGGISHSSMRMGESSQSGPSDMMRESEMEDSMRHDLLRNDAMRGDNMSHQLNDQHMRDNMLPREQSLRDTPLSSESMREDHLGSNSIGDEHLRGNPIGGGDHLRGNNMADNHLRANNIDDHHLPPHNMNDQHLPPPNNMDDKHLRGNNIDSHHLRPSHLEEHHVRSNIMEEHHVRSNMEDQHLRSSSINDQHLRSNNIGEDIRSAVRNENIEMRNDSSSSLPQDDKESELREHLRGNSFLVNEHMRNIMERRQQDLESEELRINAQQQQNRRHQDLQSEELRLDALQQQQQQQQQQERRQQELDSAEEMRLNNLQQQQQQERREIEPNELRLSALQQQQENDHHMPQDLRRMSLSHMSSELPRTNNISGGGDSGSMDLSEHMRQQQSEPSSASPGRLVDNLRLHHEAVENFNRMGAAGGYLAEHIRRMAAESRQNGADNPYNDNLRSSPNEAMALSHMGVIRPPGPPSTPQWPPHMQNNFPPIDNMNVQPNSLYSLPFWPYEHSLRHYNH